MIADADLLARLRDIHPPEAPSWWPPAPGWWLAALAAVVIAAIALRYAPGWWRRLRLRRRLAAALREAHGAAEISQLLKIAALERFPEARPAGLYGERWIAFLEARDRSPGRFAGLHGALTELPYRAAAANADLVRLRAAALGWVRAVL